MEISVGVRHWQVALALPDKPHCSAGEVCTLLLSVRPFHSGFPLLGVGDPSFAHPPIFSWAE